LSRYYLFKNENKCILSIRITSNTN